jgi:alkylation response protein AidB-like acyl-CoA dehydrogenase
MCAVPADNVVVPAGGFKKLMEAFDLERCGNATMALAQAAGALDDVSPTCRSASSSASRSSSSRPCRSARRDAMRVEAARLLIHRAAANAEKGLPSILESSIAKCFANEISREVCGHAVQLMGGYGYSREYPMERACATPGAGASPAARSTSRR